MSLLKSIGCGQMVLLVNLNQRAHSYGCLAFIETKMFATHGDFLKQDMEKENTMVSGPAWNVHVEDIKWITLLLTLQIQTMLLIGANKFEPWIQWKDG